MMTAWKDFLIQRSEEWRLPSRGNWDFLLHNNYQPNYSTMNVLWFHGSENSPRVVTKVFREPSIIEREFNNLLQIQREIPSLVPRPLHFGRVGGFWTLWMEGVSGSRLRSTAHYPPGILRSLGETVLSMHLATRKERSAFGADRYHRMISQPLDALAQFGTSSVIRERCGSMAAEIPLAWVVGLPVIPQHGDLFFGNILSDRGKWYILDWESYGIKDLPLYDLCTLTVSLLLAQGPAPEEWPPRLMEEIRRTIQGYSNKLGLSQKDTRLLLPLSLINWFHLQWEDGRKQFADIMYGVIDRYFTQQQVWENALLAPNDPLQKHSINM